LTEFGRQITPNFHSLAREFVDLDNFFDSGDVSGDGWPWSTAGARVILEKDRCRESIGVRSCETPE